MRKGRYKEDNYHPDVCGSVIAALTIFSKLFEYDPKDIDYHTDGVSDTDMRILKDAASHALYIEK